MEFKKDTENQCDNFYLVYKNNLLFAKCDIEDCTIRFYDKDTSASIQELEYLISQMRKLYAAYCNELSCLPD